MGSRRWGMQHQDPDWNLGMTSWSWPELETTYCVDAGLQEPSFGWGTKHKASNKRREHTQMQENQKWNM